MREHFFDSCAYGSCHQKPFRLLSSFVNGRHLCRRCPGNHKHIRIEGKYTKASATYTQQLGDAIAQALDESIRARARSSFFGDIDTAGLESVAVNDIAKLLRDLRFQIIETANAFRQVLEVADFLMKTSVPKHVWHHLISRGLALARNVRV